MEEKDSNKNESLSNKKNKNKNLNENDNKIKFNQSLSVNFDKIKVLVYQGSITDLSVDAITNSIDPEMNFKNRTGLCKAVYDKFGPYVETECKTLAKTNFKGRLNHGDCLMVKSGKNVPKFIINTVCPNYKSQNLEHILEDIFIKILGMVHQNDQTKSIAIPLLGTGNNGVKKLFCAKLLIETIKKRFKSLKIDEIHLVNIDLESTQALIVEMRKFIESMPSEITNIEYDFIENTKYKSINSNNNNQQNLKKSTNNTPALEFITNRSSAVYKCDLCGQRIRVCAKETTCSHVYCYGCLIDLEANNYECLIKIPNQKYDAPLTEKIANISVFGNASQKEPAKNDSRLCEICFSDEKSKKLNKCVHEFCSDCFDKIMNDLKKCPFCQTMYGVLKGDQPKNGKMSHQLISGYLPGYNDCNIICINYSIPSGIQETYHPHPGKRYSGIQRVAYLPNNKEGSQILKLLYKAFENGLTFTIGNSRTTGADDVITWNDIHHKTAISGDQFSYPDPKYLERVRAELKDKGIE